MKFVSAITARRPWQQAVDDLTQQVQSRLRGKHTDLVLAFFHPHFLPHVESLTEQLRINLAATHIIGCTAEGVIGLDAEVEHQPAIALLAAELPGVEITPFHLNAGDLQPSHDPFWWQTQTGLASDQQACILLLADPFTIPCAPLVDALSDALPQTLLVGALASGAQQAGQHRLILDDTIADEGAVAIVLAGNLRIRAVVSQGCRPIGEPFTITRADKNIVLELGGRPPLTVLQTLLPTLPAADQQLVRTSLLIGRVINEYKENFQRGDFLVRPLIGHDPQSGALAVGDILRIGQTVQFQLRDPKAADEDLRAHLARIAL
ncbi:MAG: FIST C-terminal domain-containing protein, partial [Verrucomicrobiae bacterium]|nr:FIST C-terminal domain-containing protein [Verrucomicrobiae bacterium]